MTTATKTPAKTEAKQAAKGKEVKFKNKTYPSVVALAKSLDLNPSFIRRGIRKGLSVTDAVKKAQEVTEAKKEKAKAA